MTAIVDLMDIGVSFDPDPPLSDSREPIAMGIRASEPDRFVALAALEITRFQIADKHPHDDHAARDNNERKASRSAWDRAADALGQLHEDSEFWQVIATRRTPARDGALLRTGWVAFGRASTARAAMAIAERTAAALQNVYGSLLDYATVERVTTPEAFFDLVFPGHAPFVRSFRRQPEVVSLGVGLGPDRGTAKILRPWPSGRPPWAELCGALAAQHGPAAFVVRAQTLSLAPAKALSEAERTLLHIAAEQERVDSSNPREVVRLPHAEQPMAIAAKRLDTLRAPAFALDAVLATYDPITPGLSAIAVSSLVAERDNEVRPRLVGVDRAAQSLWNRFDLEAETELLVGRTEAAALLRTVEPPGDERSPLPCTRARTLSLRPPLAEGRLLGDCNAGTGLAEVRVPEATRFQHIYVVGQTGTGKSTLLLNLLLEDIRAGNGVTVLDPHGSLISEVLANLPDDRVDDVVLIDPGRSEWYAPLNPLSLPGTASDDYLPARDRIIEELLDVFDALYDLSRTGGPIFEQCFRTGLCLLMGHERPRDYTPLLPMLELVLGDKKVRATLTRRLEHDDPITASVVHNLEEARGEAEMRNLVPYVTSKLTRFYGAAHARRMLCQPGCLDFDAILSDRRIVLAELSAARIGTEAAALIARQIVLRLTIAAIRRGTHEATPAHFIYADEFQHFASERFASLLSEARKFRLGLVLAHQYTSQLVRSDSNRLLDAVLGNVGTIISFRVGKKDAALLGEVMAPRARTADIFGLPNYAALVRSVGIANVPFTLFTRPPPEGRGRTDEAFLDRARSRNATHRDEVDEGIIDRVESIKNVGSVPATPGIVISSLAASTSELGLSARTVARLDEAQVTTVGDLLLWSRSQLRRVTRCGSADIVAISKALRQVGLRLRAD